MPPSIPPARAVARAICPSRRHDLVVGLRAVACGGGEPVSDLRRPSPTGCSSARGARRRVELAVVVDVRAEPGRASVGDHLEHAPDRVPILPDPIDLGHHLLGDGLVEAPNRRGVDGLEVLRARASGSTRAPRPSRSERRGTRSGCPSSARNALQTAPIATRAAVSRALARSRTLRTSSNPYFMRAGEVGVSRAGPGEPVGRIPLAFDRHQVPVLPLPLDVRDRDRDRRAERACRGGRRSGSRSASVSSFCRPPRPCPCRRRASSPAICFGATGTPAGMPSRTATRPSRGTRRR